MKKYILALIFSMVLFTGCGDENTEPQKSGSVMWAI